MPLAGHWEILVLAVLALLLFGGGMLPKIARSAGRTVREVHNVKNEMLALDAPPPAKPDAPPTD